MRIIIEIEGVEEAGKSAKVGQVFPQSDSIPTMATGPATPVEMPAPSEVLAAAAAIGAENAGAAPTAGAHFPGMPPLQIPAAAEPIGPITGIADSEAGAAPTASLNEQESTKTEET